MQTMAHANIDNMVTAQKIWNYAGTAFGMMISLIVFFAGGPITAMAVITSWFLGVGLIFEGLAVHERY
jgi:hypothetical protein